MSAARASRSHGALGHAAQPFCLHSPRPAAPPTQRSDRDRHARRCRRLAEASGRKTMMLFDRGLMDGKAYMSESQWELLLEEL